MDLFNTQKNIAVISTYPPRECGLATFTQDLITAIKELESINIPKVIAVSNNSYNYNEDVMLEIIQHDFKSYSQTAFEINNSDIDVLVIQHEYGIFGGNNGEYILELVNKIKIPILTVFHTVLSTPSSSQKEILYHIANKSTKVVTMAKNTADILYELYHIDKNKIEVINHGVPSIEMPSRETLKKKLGLENNNIITTFGLISPGKGIEYAIHAMNKVVKSYPETIYFILGQTHPCIKQNYGDHYRQTLMKLVKNLNLERNVIFIDKYLTKEELIQYLQLSDIYMTPYIGKEQAVSGTLAYAIGYGRVVVSTPYTYAQEMLGEGRGIFADFKNADSLATCVQHILENPSIKQDMETATLKLGKTMRWNCVAEQYNMLLINILSSLKKAVI